MTISTQELVDRSLLAPKGQTIGFGAFIAAALIVAALVITVIKVTSDAPVDQPSLIKFDEPASLSGFTA